MALIQNPSSPSRWQGETVRSSPRDCLLKGCDRYFSPNHPLQRFCGEDCREAAKRWSSAKANLAYRGSDNGKEKRREQAMRRRERSKDLAAAAVSSSSATPPNDQFDAAAQPRVGYDKEQSEEKSSCDRPGCYRRFTPPPRSPLQKFCCASCRKALRAVLLREHRWLERRGCGLARTRDGPL